MATGSNVASRENDLYRKFHFIILKKTTVAKNLVLSNELIKVELPP